MPKSSNRNTYFCGLSLLLLLFLVAACKQSAGRQSHIVESKKRMIDEFVSKHQVSIRVGHAVVAPQSGFVEKSLEAVKAYNAAASLPEWPDGLNPLHLDLTKVQAFLDGLPSLPTNTVDELQGKTILLNSSSLHLGTGSSLAAASIAKGYQLKIDASGGPVLNPELVAAIDSLVARENIRLANEAFASQKQEVSRLEHEEQAIRGGAEGDLSKSLIQQSQAKTKLMYACNIAVNNLSELAAGYPGNVGLRDELRLAEERLDQYLVAPSMGMPGGGMPGGGMPGGGMPGGGMPPPPGGR